MDYHNLDPSREADILQFDDIPNDIGGSLLTIPDAMQKDEGVGSNDSWDFGRASNPTLAKTEVSETVPAKPVSKSAGSIRAPSEQAIGQLNSSGVPHSSHPAISTQKDSSIPKNVHVPTADKIENGTTAQTH